MKKSRPSKLDAYKDELRAWFGQEKITCVEAQKRLAARGVQVRSLSTLSTWWQRDEEARLEETVLANLATGRVLNDRIEREFRRNPAPQLQTVVSLLKTLVINLCARGQQPGNERMLNLASKLMQNVLNSFREQREDKRLSLDQEKFERETCELYLKWHGSQVAREIAGRNATNEEKIAELRKHFFADVDSAPEPALPN